MTLSGKIAGLESALRLLKHQSLLISNIKHLEKNYHWQVQVERELEALRKQAEMQDKQDAERKFKFF